MNRTKTIKQNKMEAMGEMIIKIKKKMMAKETQIESVKERIMIERMRNRKEKWRIIGIYAEKNRLERREVTDIREMDE